MHEQIISTGTPCDREPNETATVAVITPRGAITLCNHHFAQHRAAFLARTYPVIELGTEHLREDPKPAYTGKHRH